MRLVLTVAIFVTAVSTAVASSIHEPKRKDFAHSFEHTQSGQRVYLRRGYPNECGSYARTLRLTIVRDYMGRAVEVHVERDNCFAIGQNATKKVYCEPSEMTAAIDAFCRERYQPDATVEMTVGDTVKRIQLSEMLNEKRMLDACFHQSHQEFSWCRGADELLVERKR